MQVLIMSEEMPENKIIFTCQLSKKRHEKMKKLAKELERSVNSLVVEAIVQLLYKQTREIERKAKKKAKKKDIIHKPKANKTRKKLS